MMMMEMNNIKKYLLNELKEERQKWLMGKENQYSCIFMICNDIGITLTEDPTQGY